MAFNRIFIDLKCHEEINVFVDMNEVETSDNILLKIIFYIQHAFAK